MAEEAEYLVEYTDDRPEETRYLSRAGDVKISYANGDIFEGTIDSNKLKQGQGKYIWQERSEDGELQVVATYEGNYVDGIKQGLGKMTFANGDVYQGEWQNNNMHGEGSMNYANGDIFSGTFVQGLREGRGTYEYGRDQSLLVGNWVKHDFSDGKWCFKDGGSYVGRFENGKPIGPCMFKLPTGMQQDGEYVKIPDAEGDTFTTKYVGRDVVRVR